MHKSFQFWFATALALGSIVALNPAMAQLPPVPPPVSSSSVIRSIAPLAARSIGSAIKPRQSIPAWSDFSERWMFVDIFELVAPACSRQNGSQFIITGRGGMSPTPSEFLNIGEPLVDWVEPIQERENLNRGKGAVIFRMPPAPEHKPYSEASGWVTNDNGEVILTAAATNVTPHSSWYSAANCHTFQTGS